MTLSEAKRAMRRNCAERRRRAKAAAGPDAAERAAGHFLAAVPMPAGGTVSAYWTMDDEFDAGPLLERLHAAGYVCALPVVTPRGEPLMFRQWMPGQALEAGPYGTSAPPPEAPGATPDVLAVPLLAFDRAGYRLGYGGGYYDRTLRALRAAGRAVVAAGLAFAGQEVDEVPRGPGDERLDWVVTERGARRVA